MNEEPLTKTTQFAKKVYEVLMSVPSGRVVTYGDVARVLGNSCYARAVGNALHHNPKKGVIPCHRVVNGKGELASHFAFGGLKGQQCMLESEGVCVENGRVDLNKFQYKGL